MASAPPRYVASDAEPDLGFGEFKALARILYDHAGIQLADSKRTLMAGRLTKRVRGLGLSGFRAYLDLVSNDAAECARMVEALTTNHTSFFRENHHFDHLTQAVLPELLAQARSGKRVRIWSAGCSSGEEPYTIAMCLIAAARKVSALDWLSTADVAILATDLSTAVLETALAGRYSAAAGDTIPEAYQGFVRRQDDATLMSQQLKDLITFRRLNLLHDWPMRGPFDVIFCRNVMIYFDEPTKERLCGRFVDALVPDGQLYIGHSERICGDPAERVRLVGQTAYRRVR